MNAENIADDPETIALRRITIGEADGQSIVGVEIVFDMISPAAGLAGRNAIDIRVRSPLRTGTETVDEILARSLRETVETLERATNLARHAVARDGGFHVET